MVFFGREWDERLGGEGGGGLTPSVIQWALLSRGQNEALSLLVFKFNRAASSSIKT